MQEKTIFFGLQVHNFKDMVISNLAAQELGNKAVSVEILACSTQWKMNLVIQFAFQVFPQYGDAPAVPASR